MGRQRRDFSALQIVSSKAEVEAVVGRIVLEFVLVLNQFVFEFLQCVHPLLLLQEGQQAEGLPEVEGGGNLVCVCDVDGGGEGRRTGLIFYVNGETYTVHYMLGNELRIN